MGEVNRDPCGVVTWSATTRALPGMIECGDRCTIAPFADGVTLAMIDGLGHGHEAALASRVIGAVIERHAALDPGSLLAKCHEEARSTRGAVIAIARVDARTSSVAWTGVGNVDAVLLRGAMSAGSSRDSLVSRGGVVGLKPAPVQVSTKPIGRGDLLVFATDGVKSGYHAALAPHLEPSVLVDQVVEGFAKDTDDVGVLVASYEGGFSSESTLSIREESDIVVVRQAVRSQSHVVALEDKRIEALAAAATEIARNALVHAGGGVVGIGRCTKDQRQGVLVVVRDTGPGIEDVSRAMVDGFTTIGTLGLGLPSAKRLVDELEIVSTVGRGTTIVMREWAS